jgi:hypothetical protein
VGSGYRGLLETADEGARPVAQWPRRPSGRGPEANPRHRCREAVPRHPSACSAKALATLANMRNVADQPCRPGSKGSASCPFALTVQTSHIMVSRRPRWAPLIPVRDNGDLQDGQMC